MFFFAGCRQTSPPVASPNDVTPILNKPELDCQKAGSRRRDATIAARYEKPKSADRGFVVYLGRLTPASPQRFAALQFHAQKRADDATRYSMAPPEPVGGTDRHGAPHPHDSRRRHRLCREVRTGSGPHRCAQAAHPRHGRLLLLPLPPPSEHAAIRED